MAGIIAQMNAARRERDKRKKKGAARREADPKKRAEEVAKQIKIRSLLNTVSIIAVTFMYR